MICSVGLSFTTFSSPKSIRGGQMLAVNVCAGDVSCTLNTRYEDMSLPMDILSLRHFPKTVVLYEYEL